ncbi:MAG: hypothetical protein ACI910_002902 [Oleispira sp.]|jgi:hypothetical protein
MTVSNGQIADTLGTVDRSITTPLQLKHFEEVGGEEKAAITRQVSLVVWQNINLNGTYNFTSTKKLPDLYELMRSIVQS